MLVTLVGICSTVSVILLYGNGSIAVRLKRPIRAIRCVGTRCLKICNCLSVTDRFSLCVPSSSPLPRVVHGITSDMLTVR